MTLGHAHIYGNLFVRPLGIPNTNRCIKFEVSTCSSSSFKDMFDRMPKIVGPRELGHAQFQGKLFVLGVLNTKPQIEVSSSSSFGAIDVAMVDMTLNDL